MARLVLDDEQLQVKLSAWERVGAFSGDVSVPVTAITTVERLTNARSAIRGIRSPGTGLPGVIALGRWRKRGVVDFVAVYRNNPGYLIELDGERFDRIVISSDPLPDLEELT